MNENEITVYDGHFWVNIDEILNQKRKDELKKDIPNTESLLLVKGQIWARIEFPHPTKKQKKLFKADWKENEVK